MANEQVNLPSLLVILVLTGLVVRYFFFSSSGSPPAAQQAGRAGRRDAASVMAAREAAVVRLQQLFPQVDRRTLLWDLQRTGGNIAATADRIATRRIETPPITFQPPPPPGGQATGGSTEQTHGKPEDKPAQPDLITRYRLQGKLAEGAGSGSETESRGSSPGGGKTKAWSSNRDERQSLLQRRRDEMILEARRKMEAKIAAEKAAAES
ncbi:hypothetical protein B0T16DRAFT_392109 [Cercophora newfieldiana]|uniref:CUE domain-containing protein n=1 Tax=Cercophora newfieldiana TaxID=92897 RepID=A0AA40CLQ2_9PEZI|nr:hypothetical protein B0T16DRAFT_392109 [Cercophora newfieldiana]